MLFKTHSFYCLSLFLIALCYANATPETPFKKKAYNTVSKPIIINDFIECNTVACILEAMRTAQPGDEIVIAPGTYIPIEKDNTDGRASRFFSAADGDAENRITIRAKTPSNPPILKAPEGSYDGYVMRILGDYWHLKDLILEDGSKGLVFDTANHGIIENITVRDIGEEGIHLRDGSSDNLITNCNISHTGIKKPGFGEGLYVGSDKSQHHTTYNPDCNNNTIENCIVGPHVTAEGVDVKEGALNTIIRNCTFSAEGITGENSADAFIDLKGAYTYVYNNTFNLDGSTVINAVIDFQDRKTNYNTGYRNAVFSNTFHLGLRANAIPSMRAKGGKPSEIHFWDNTRTPNGNDPISDFSLRAMVLSCPDWNIMPCEDEAPILNATDVTLNTATVYAFPNPLKSGNLTLNNLPLQALDIQLIDLQGKRLLQQKSRQQRNIQLELSKLKAGVYIVAITGSGYAKSLLLSKR